MTDKKGKAEKPKDPKEGQVETQSSPTNPPEEKELPDKP
jgi:hypothetical protein